MEHICCCEDTPAAQLLKGSVFLFGKSNKREVFSFFYNHIGLITQHKLPRGGLLWLRQPGQHTEYPAFFWREEGLFKKYRGFRTNTGMGSEIYFTVPPKIVSLELFLAKAHYDSMQCWYNMKYSTVQEISSPGLLELLHSHFSCHITVQDPDT